MHQALKRLPIAIRPRRRPPSSRRKPKPCSAPSAPPRPLPRRHQMQAPHPRRPCFTAQKASAPIDQVWRTAVRVECAAPEGLRLGSSQWGLEKFYERLQHPHLIAHASQLGMPIAHVRAPIRAYRLLRFHSFNAACSGGICPRVGVVAGCAGPTSASFTPSTRSSPPYLANPTARSKSTSTTSTSPPALPPVNMSSRASPAQLTSSYSAFKEAHPTPPSRSL